MNKDYDKIDFGVLVALLLKKWWLIILLVAVSMGSTYIVTSRYVQPVYEARTSLFIGKESSDIGSVSLNDLQMYSQLVVDYNQIVQSNLVIESVIKDKKLNTTVKDFKRKLKIDMIEQSRFFSISFEDTNPVVAASIANELADKLIIAASEIVEVERIIVIDKAMVPDKPVKPNMVINLAVALLFSMALSLLIVVLNKIFDNKISTEEDVEKILKLSVIGVIPMIKPEHRRKSK